MSLASYFSDKEIILQLCKERVKLANQRHEAQFLHNIDPRIPGLKIEKPFYWDDHISADIFPSRRQGHKFRPVKADRTKSSIDVNLGALVRAVLTLRRKTPNVPWVQRLDVIVTRIRARALADDSFSFQPPTILPEEKEKGSDVFRPLSVFKLEDKIIERQVACYLRRTLDYLFRPCCLAFRCSQNRVPPPTIHDALELITSFRSKAGPASVFAAECDIRGFFDCVPHDLAKQAVGDLISEHDSTGSERVDRRAWSLFLAYLRAYSFNQQVKLQAEPRLKEKRPGAYFKWPMEELSALHDDIENIGVPQGGALSCLIANAALHAVDKVLEGITVQQPGKLLYLRYCDDMILLATDRLLCETALQSYCGEVETLDLLIHPCKEVEIETKGFYSGKSHNPYPWGKLPTQAPWIQFVGYQIRYDGLVRVRLKSLKKQRQRMTEIADEVLAMLNPGRSKPRQITPQSPTIRRTAQQIRHRLRQRLISISVGRRRLGHSLSSVMPMCWCNGFRGLKGRPLVESALKSLDRHRERQMARVNRRLKKLHLPKSTESDKVEALRFYGMPFSYWGQFISED